MKLDPKKRRQVTEDGELIFDQISPGTWVVRRKAVVGFRLSESTVGVEEEDGKS